MGKIDRHIGHEERPEIGSPSCPISG